MLKGWRRRRILSRHSIPDELWAATVAATPAFGRLRADQQQRLRDLVLLFLHEKHFEPVQGMAGARDCAPDFLRAARIACDREGAVLIFDEIQCGVGRCGAFTAAEAFEVVPDILTLAKGLAAGLPIGAMVATTAITAGLKVGDLGSTFGGGPVPCAAALANLEVIRRDRLVDNAVMVGDHIRRAASRIPAVVDISGRGLLLGLKLDRPAAGVQRALFESRVLTGTASDPNILRLMPPLSFSRTEANLLIDALRRALT